MGNLFQQIYTIITTNPGNLIYHLELTFAIAIALLVVWIQPRPGDPSAGRRTMIGLGILLATRLVSFILAGLAWQGLLNEHLLLPPVDRAITLLTILIIVWLWVFPLPSRRADAMTWLLGLLVAVFYIFTMVWWIDAGTQSYYNGTWPDLVAQITGAVLLAVGCVILYRRRPAGWGFGQGMILTLLVGIFVFLISLPSSGDYPAPVRLAQMIAFPLLSALVLQFPQDVSQEASPPAPGPERGATGVDPVLIQGLMALSGEKDLARIAQVITHAISSAVPAEICLLISPPDEDETILVYCGYDQVCDQPVEGFSLQCLAIPNITSAMHVRIEQSLEGESVAPDSEALCNALNLRQTGNVHISPVMATGELLAGILLLSPYSQHGWSSAEKQVLASLLPPVAHLLQRTQVLEELLIELEKYREILNQSGDDLEWIQNGTEATMAQYPDPLSASLKGGVIPMPMGIDSDYIEGELRLALEEIARLNSALSDADLQLLNMQNRMDTSRLLSDQSQAFIETIQELRQSMAAVIGYTDFLLAESVGILGGMQRRFLERVKVSTERMNRLVENLVSMTSVKDGRHLIKFKLVDLKEVVVEAIANTDDLFREKSISLKLDLPEQAPELETDQTALQQMITYLLENAAKATPARGEVSLCARLESDEQARGYYLIQIADQGGGIGAADIPRVFSRIPPSESAAIAGLGSDSQQMVIVKRLVEALDGRIWVDSTPEVGATFSILLPITQLHVNADAEPGGLDE